MGVLGEGGCGCELWVGEVLGVYEGGGLYEDGTGGVVSVG